MPKPEYVPSPEKVAFFKENGFVTLDDVIGAEELARYIAITRDLLSGAIDTKDKRGDLGGHTDRVDAAVENTVQICHPYVLTSALDECEHFRKGRDICNALFDDDAVDFALDCSQILVKPAGSMTATPWHQDQSYYPDALVDKRAANVWLALEDVSVEMGCMQFHPVPLAEGAGKFAPHRPAGNGKGALTTDPPPGESIKAPLKAGSVVVFANYTFHYAGPNTSDAWRPAFVAQYRPRTMVQACRVLGFDHGKFAANSGEGRTTDRLKLSALQ